MANLELRTTNYPPVFQSAFSDLYERLDQAGFDEKFVRQYVLPAWWSDELENVQETRTLAESTIASLLGLSLASLRTTGVPLKSMLNGDYGLPQDQDAQIYSMLPVIALAQSVATLLAGVMSNLPAFQSNDTPATVRQAILEKRQSVDLQGLLDWSWRHGIVVAHLHKRPRASKPFSAITMYSHGHPVILLGSDHDAPPWLAFHLAYELGHVLEGRLQPGKPIVDRDLDKPLEMARSHNNAVHGFESINGNSGSDGKDENERAKEFAMMLLTARPDLRFKRNQHLTVQQLAPRVSDTERTTRINGGTLALIYGRSARQMQIAHRVLKVLGYHEGGRHLIAVGVQQHLPDELPKSLAAVLPLIGCI